MQKQSPTAAGKTSYDLADADLFWRALPVTPGMTVLDLGCGVGRYAIPLSAKVGPAGAVIAVDLWAEGVARLRETLAASGIRNVETHVAEARALPLAQGTVDLCLMATVLHDFAADGGDDAVIAEVCRILKPEGTLAVVEFIKQEGPPGPPERVRLSPAEVGAKLLPFGLTPSGAVVGLGAHLYYEPFRRLRGAAST